MIIFIDTTFYDQSLKIEIASLLRNNSKEIEVLECSIKAISPNKKAIQYLDSWDVRYEKLA